MRGVSVVLVEDHALLAQSLGIALHAEGYDVTVPPVHDPDQLLADVLAARPDVVLLDLDLGEGGGDGSDLVAPLTQAGARVVIVSGVTDPLRIAGAVEAGAVGHVRKSRPIEELMSATARVAAGEPLLGADERHRLLTQLRRDRASRAERDRPFAQLTPREAQVLRALADGHSVDAIAHEWVVSEATVRSQVRGVLTKLGVSSQLAAVAMARRAGWLDSDEQS